MKFLFESEEQIFSLTEESDFFRMKVGKSEVKEDHVEEFMDKTVEWLSHEPGKRHFDRFAWGEVRLLGFHCRSDPLL